MSRIHVAGIGGVGMRGLSELLHARGHAVSGSDRFLDQGRRLAVLDVLEGQGISLHVQDGSALDDGVDVFVYSSAIEEDNPEWVRARALGVECVHRAAMLAREASEGELLAIAGTAGKTTVTALVGWILDGSGLDPTVLNGGALVGWRGGGRTGNVRVGASPWWVLEVDESDRSLLGFAPHTGLITNISTDHFDLEETYDLFVAFAGGVGSRLLLGPGVSDALFARFVSAAPLVERVVGDFGCDAEGAWAVFEGLRYRCSLPGRHNGENVLNAVALCRSLGVASNTIAEALLCFEGVERRLEVVGRGEGFVVVDDYAHNPAKIAAAWKAVAAMGRRVCGVWRPHGFGPLAQFADALEDALEGVLQESDCLYILPVFYAGGTTEAALTAEEYALRLQGKGLLVEYVEDYEALFMRMKEDRQTGDAVVFMGARDPDLPIMARELARRYSCFL